MSSSSEAELRDAPLVALHVWTAWEASMPDPQNPSAPYWHPHETPAEAKGRLLSEALADRERRHSGVMAHHRVVRGRTTEALIEASRPAQLTVVGGRGGGRFAGLRPGSGSGAVPCDAYCSVAVVRGVQD